MNNTLLEGLVHPWQRHPIVEKTICTQGLPVWTMVMPVFNQEKRLKEVVSKIIKNAALKFNIVFIDDASDDASLDIIKLIARELKADKESKVTEVTIIHNPVPIYETACDNQGFKVSVTDYIIEIQSDIHIEEYGFDKKMIHAMSFLKLGAVSGRHVHSYSLLEGRRGWLKYPFELMAWRALKRWNYEGFGRLGYKIFDRMNRDELENVCFIGETVARGPWLLNKADLINLSYLDESSFFLGNDDHDYHRRLFEKLGKFVGYVPLDIYSICEDGSTRKPRVGVNKKIYDFLKQNKQGSLAFKAFMKRYKPFMTIKKIKL